jgi:hypothetical protein
MKDSSDQQENLALAGRVIKEFSKMTSVFLDDRRGLSSKGIAKPGFSKLECGSQKHCVPTDHPYR